METDPCVIQAEHLYVIPKVTITLEIHKEETLQKKRIYI
jgi:hypothetical protein